MNKGLIRILEAVLVMISLTILALAVLWLPYATRISADLNPEVAYLKFPILIGMYLACIPFYMGVLQTFKLLRLIRRESAFTEEACKSLKVIIFSAIGVMILFLIGIIYLDVEEALPPALFLAGIVIIFAAFVIAVFAAVLKALLLKAIEIKNENELTI